MVDSFLKEVRAVARSLSISSERATEFLLSNSGYTYMEITLLLAHVTPSHGESPQGSSDCPHVGGAFCH
jgi:hypothetical protein